MSGSVRKAGRPRLYANAPDEVSEWAIARLLPARLVVSLGGAVALFMSIDAYASTSGLEAAFLGGLGAAMLIVAWCLRPNWPWSLRLASISAAVGAVVWVVAMLRAGRQTDASEVLVGLGLAASSLWVFRFLAGELAPVSAPEAGYHPPTGAPHGADIEELRSDDSSAMLARGGESSPAETARVRVAWSDDDGTRHTPGDMGPQWRWPQALDWHRDHRVQDAALAGILALLGLVLLVPRGGEASAQQGPAVLSSLLLSTLPLAVRRIWPTATLIVIVPAYLAYVSQGVPEITAPSISLLVALFSTGAFSLGSRRNVVRGGAVLVLLTYVVAHVIQAFQAIDFSVVLFLVGTIALNGFLYSAAWLMGDAYRQRRRDERELGRRARQIEQQREERERGMIEGERLRIAREIHDTVSHYVSLMGVQAAAARTMLPTSPAESTDLLRGVERTSRQAVAEMQRLLSALRTAGGEVDDGRRVSLSQMDTLLAGARQAGVDVILRVNGNPLPSLPETLDLCAYRIVQEALTNIVKHSSATSAAVTIEYEPHAVTIEVTDPGPPRTRRGGPGSGLIGMHERADLFAGSLSAGTTAEGGFAVRARLPISRSP